MHDMRTICARFVQKIPPLLSVIAICANGRRDQQLYRTIGDQPPVAGKLGTKPPDGPVCRGEMGQTPESILVSAHPDHLCIVLAIEQHFNGKQCKAKPTNVMQISQMSHIDNASSLNAVKKIELKFTNTLLY